MSANGEAAAAMFLEGYNCAQAVLATCGREYGLPRETAVKVAQAFGGGMGRTGSVCGAVTGALMVIGLKYSAADAADTAAKAKASDIAHELLARFKQRNGSLLCRELTGFDLTTPEGHQKLVESGRHKTVCAKVVRDAAEILEELLKSAEKKA